MSLTDIMSAAGLSSWAEFGLILCFFTFASIVIWVFVAREKRSYEHLRGLPLENDSITEPAQISEGGRLS